MSPICLEQVPADVPTVRDFYRKDRHEHRGPVATEKIALFITRMEHPPLPPPPPFSQQTLEELKH
jgi:hypothetical protein